MGGHSPGAYRRAVEHGNGWYGFALTPDATGQAIDGLRQAAEQYARPRALGDLEISITPRGALDEATVEQYAALGVHRLIVQPRPRLDAAGLEEWVTDLGERFVRRR